MKQGDEGVRKAALAELLGAHMLDAVDFDNDAVNLLKAYNPDLEAASTIAFRLDGVVYVAVEDPDDGYRSSMSHIYIVDARMVNVFPAVKVWGQWAGADEALVEFMRMDGGAVLLEVGTDVEDGYYPCFISSFKPENMPVNKEGV